MFIIREFAHIANNKLQNGYFYGVKDSTKSNQTWYERFLLSKGIESEKFLAYLA